MIDGMNFTPASPAYEDMRDGILQSVANGHTNCSAAGLGEAPSCAAAASIANAVFHAASVPLRHLPITPDKVLKALSQRKAK